MRRGQLVDGRYKIVAQVGAGGMGMVYRATDERSGTPVALKVLSAPEVASEGRFAREARLLAELTHPAIVRYVGQGLLDDGATYLAMEWVDGVSLAERLETVGLNLQESVRMALRVAEALAEPHRKGVVHRDVKTTNLLLPDGDVEKIKVIDFGIARRAREVQKLTATGVMVGSPGYVAPEQARAAGTIDPRADVFALGCVLYECVTGVPAFAGEHLVARLAKVLLADPEPIESLAPEAPPALSALVQRMLAKEPDQRPANGEELARALSALGPMPPSPRRPHRHDDQPTREIAAPATLPEGPPASQAQPRASLCLVLAAGADVDWTTPALLDRTLDQSRESERVLRDLVSPQGGHLELLADGSVVVSMISADPIGLVKRAAQTALSLRKRLPEMSMMLATEVEGRVARPDAVMELIDRGVRALGADALQAIFAEYRTDPLPNGAIRVDGLAARLLQREFELVQSKSGFFLVGERVGQA